MLQSWDSQPIYDICQDFDSYTPPLDDWMEVLGHNNQAQHQQQQQQQIHQQQLPTNSNCYYNEPMTYKSNAHQYNDVHWQTGSYVLTPEYLEAELRKTSSAQYQSHDQSASHNKSIDTNTDVSWPILRSILSKKKPEQQQYHNQPTQAEFSNAVSSSCYQNSHNNSAENLDISFSMLASNYHTDAMDDRYLEEFVSISENINPSKSLGQTSARLDSGTPPATPELPNVDNETTSHSSAKRKQYKYINRAAALVA